MQVSHNANVSEELGKFVKILKMQGQTYKELSQLRGFGFAW